MYDCITIGDIKLDTFVLLEDASVHCELKLPECQLCIEYGGKIPVEAIDSQIAGSAPNIAVGLSRLGLSTAVFSVMGKDHTYHIALARMREEGVATPYIVTDPRQRSSFAVVLNYKGEKTILVSHKPYIYRLPKLAPTRWLYVSELGTGYLALYREVLRTLRTGRLKLGMNPGSIQIKERRKELYDLMKKTSLLFLNVGEARTLTKSSGSAKVKNVVAAAGRLNHQIVIVTAGRDGSYVFDGNTMLFLKMFPGKRVESTGAGDSFATGVLGATIAGLPLEEAVRWGAVNSASVVGQIGPQAGLLSAAEIRRRLKAHPSFKATALR